MAPEVLRGKTADAGSDVWALGVMLHEMLAGGRPFRGNTGSEVTSPILRDPPPPLPAGVPTGLQTIVRRCLEKEPGRRYQRAGEVRAALQAASTETAVSLATAGLLRPYKTGALAAIVAVVLVVAGAVYLGTRPPVPADGEAVESAAVSRTGPPLPSSPSRA